MGLNFNYYAGQTPLDEDEKQGLLIASIATRGELDEFEQKNIEDAVEWSLKRTLKVSDIFNETFIRELHRKMYGNVWAWAGTFRKTNKNLGVDKWEISLELKKLLDDAIFWVENKSYTPDEIVIRFKHRLVSIHCFPNGNGRHSRLMADIIIDKVYKLPVFTWGDTNLMPPGDVRNTYLKAIKEADKGNYSNLLAFSRS